MDVPHTLQVTHGKNSGFDYGLKRTGIAVTDPLRIIATPLETVMTANLFQFLTSYMQKENVDEFVVGNAEDTFKRRFGNCSNG